MYNYMYNYMPCNSISWKKLGCRTNLVLTQSQRNRMDSDTKNHVLKPMKKKLVESVRSLPWETNGYGWL
jgi:hypothetical protein